MKNRKTRNSSLDLSGPPTQPRPKFDVLASFERIYNRTCAEAGGDATAKLDEFTEEGRIAAEAAKGREQALSVLGIGSAER
jgi:hypothetical protein